MVVGFVYKWIDESNDMYYIGSHAGTTDDGYIGSGKRFKRAYRKRPHSFVREIMYEGIAFRQYEEFLLQYLDCANDDMSYNLINGSTGIPFGHKHSDETKRKLSELNKGKSPSKETRIKLSKSLKGRVLPQSAIEASAKAKMKRVYCGYLDKEFDSMKDCAKALNVSKATITRQIKNVNQNKYRISLIL